MCLIKDKLKYTGNKRNYKEAHEKYLESISDWT